MDERHAGSPQRDGLNDGQPWSARMADTMIARHTPEQVQWHYDYGLVLMAIQHVGRATGDPHYGDHVRRIIDQLVAPDGAIHTYRPGEYNIDQVNPGRALFPLYRATGDERYRRPVTGCSPHFWGRAVGWYAMAVAGLGGAPYRDGSYAYYVGEPIRPNDYKGVGPFILASLEMEGAQRAG
jgi:rhamnogalacturonyl hydrolase YesR